MKQPTNVHIATPCHEDWNAMTPAKDGRFCASCSKQVVDFTLMSDAQILQFLSKHSGGLCGRFDAGQLERPLVEPVVSKKKSWYLALVLPFTLLLQKGFAQKGERKTGKPVVKTEQKERDAEPVVMGMLLPPVSEWVTVQGTLLNEAGDPVESASVLVKGTSYGSVTDSSGRFSIKLRREGDSVVLMASLVGYESAEKKVDWADADKQQVLTLAEREATLGEVVVTSSANMLCGRLGGFVTYRTITYTEKKDSAVRKLLRLNPVTVYPNPVRSGGSVQVKFAKAGTYEVQLLSSASALLRTQTMQAGSDGAPMAFSFPAQLAAGVYYLRVLSDDKKRPYLEKVLVN